MAERLIFKLTQQPNTDFSDHMPVLKKNWLWKVKKTKNRLSHHIHMYHDLDWVKFQFGYRYTCHAVCQGKVCWVEVGGGEAEHGQGVPHCGVLGDNEGLVH